MSKGLPTYFGYISFDNILLALANCFSVITMDGWTYIMYQVQASPKIQMDSNLP